MSLRGKDAKEVREMLSALMKRYEAEFQSKLPLPVLRTYLEELLSIRRLGAIKSTFEDEANSTIYIALNEVERLSSEILVKELRLKPQLKQRGRPKKEEGYTKSNG
jgi:hypothetical protein